MLTEKTDTAGVLFFANHLHMAMPMSTGFHSAHNTQMFKETDKMYKINVFYLSLYKQVEGEALTAPKGHSI